MLAMGRGPMFHGRPQQSPWSVLLWELPPQDTETADVDMCPWPYRGRGPGPQGTCVLISGESPCGWMSPSQQPCDALLSLLRCAAKETEARRARLVPVHRTLLVCWILLETWV